MTLKFGIKESPQCMGAVSYSRLSTYEKCPRQAKYKFLDKLPEPDSPHLARGSRIHTYCEDFLKDPEPIVLDEIAAVVDYLQWIRDYGDHQLITETQMALDKEWNPCDWFSPLTAMRVIYDVAAISSDSPDTLLIVDHKTGKVYQDAHADQMSLYALTALYLFPEIEAVDVRMLYVDQGGMTDVNVFVREDLERLHARWDKRIERAATDTELSPNPSSFNCKWCAFSNTAGGPCEHG